MKTSIAAILLAMSMLTTAHGQDLTGTWLMRLAHDPDAVAYMLVFWKQDGRLNGASRLAGHSVPLLDLRMEGPKVSFNLESGTEATRFVGTIDAQDRMSVNINGEDFPFSYQRASQRDLKLIEAEPSYSFEKLPLPPLREVASNGLALTPPMGVGNMTLSNDKTVRHVANLMVANGLRDAGYVYINIDEGWQGRRDAQGKLHPNKNFPDMKALADYVHSKGLKLGIYSSPGPVACWGFAGSHGHEEQDARTFAEWGVDYLKYDWCSAGMIYHTPSEMRALYQKMGEALQASGRPILYGLCQYGLHDVGAWGSKVGANLWRTGGDVDMGDKWVAMSRNGLDGNGNPRYASPGHWNDPDALQIGKKGLTTEEYRTQMTIWSMLAAPLFIDMGGNDRVLNDIAKWSPALKEIVLNSEVIAIDQDKLAVQGRQALKKGSIEIWTKPLVNGEMAVALFNRGPTSESVSLRWSDVGLKNVRGIRDLWRKSDVSSLSEVYETALPSHGSVLLKVTANLTSR